jgi:REP element-mobilizing transposase RayT
MIMTSGQGHHSLRIGRRSFAGQVYLLTTVTYLRRPYFLDADVARLVARSLSSPERWFPSRCLAWVLMPDHWHGLVELGDGETLAVAMQRMKGVTARLTGIHDRQVKPLWAKGFHDRALRRDESVRCAARYIVANPVRAGLAETVKDYPYWDACFMDQEGAVEGFD